jgi:hypothetical protein
MVASNAQRAILGGDELAEHGNRGLLTLRDGHSAGSWGQRADLAAVSNPDLTSALTLR